MRPFLVVSLLFLSTLVIHQAKGIRLEKGFMQIEQQKVHDKEEKSSLIKRSINDGIGEVIICKEGHCKGMNRKLTTVTTSATSSTTSSTTSSKKKENGGSKANPMTKEISSNGEEREKFTINSEHQEVSHDNFVDIMDYSPARRKPPIHN